MDSEGFWILSEEKLYIGDDPEGHIIDGQLIEAERQRPAPLEPAHGPLDDVAPPVGGLVEVLVAWLIVPRGDHRVDVPPLQPVAHPGIAVPLVPRPLLRPAFLALLRRPLGTVHDLREALGLVALTGGHPHGQDDALAVTDQVRFGAKAAPRTSQRMIRWLLQLRCLGSAQLRRRLGIFFSPRRQRYGRG